MNQQKKYTLIIGSTLFSCLSILACEKNPFYLPEEITNNPVNYIQQQQKPTVSPGKNGLLHKTLSPSPNGEDLPTLSLREIEESTKKQKSPVDNGSPSPLDLSASDEKLYNKIISSPKIPTTGKQAMLKALFDIDYQSDDNQEEEDEGYDSE